MPDETAYDEIKFGIGQPVARVEDPRLLTGGGRFTYDTSVPGQAYAYFVRSQVAHGEIRGIRTGSYMDYPMPRADHIPAIDFATDGVPCMANPLGVKGCGEAGNGGSYPSTINAILNALAELGVEDLALPATPARVWAAIRAAAA